MNTIGKKLLEFFGNLLFNEEAHRYEVNGVSKKSVSHSVEGFVEYTDFDAIAERMATKNGRRKEDILAEWAAKNKAACDRGHRVHAFAEGDMSKPELPQEHAVVKFWKELDGRYYPVVKELRMYHNDVDLAGTTDLLLYDLETDTYVIADYKTNEDLFKNFMGKTLIEPFEYLLDHPYNHYQIQLSFYQILLEQTGITISERWVIWLKEDGTYIVLKPYDLTGPLTEYLKVKHPHYVTV